MGIDDTKRLDSVSGSVEVGTYACTCENDSHSLCVAELCTAVTEWWFSFSFLKMEDGVSNQFHSPQLPALLSEGSRI